MEVYTQPVSGLVELIENGRFNDPLVETILKKNLRPLLNKGVDTLVLGCTHYPLLREQIAAICGPLVEVIDTAEPVARQLWRRLVLRGRLNPGPASGQSEYFSSGDTATVTRVARKIMADPALAVFKSVI